MILPSQLILDADGYDLGIYLHGARGRSSGSKRLSMAALLASAVSGKIKMNGKSTYLTKKEASCKVANITHGKVPHDHNPFFHPLGSHS